MRAAENCSLKDFSLAEMVRSECLSGPTFLARLCYDTRHYFAVMIAVAPHPRAPLRDRIAELHLAANTHALAEPIITATCGEFVKLPSTR
jgi:hypothetical protein